MHGETGHELDRLFFPSSIAMVGASPKAGSRWDSANSYMAACMEQGFQGKIYPVHPHASSILGYPCYRRVLDIPGEIDLAIFTVPTSVALEVMKDCVAKGVKFAHLLTAGFSETGRSDHAELERKLVEIAAQGGVRIVGPNCMGLYCPEGGLAWNRGFPTKSGPVGLFSQSGQLASHFIMEGAAQGLRFSKAVSFGNARGLQAHDFLEYLAQDEKTRILAAYLEGLRDGRAFFDAAGRVTAEKPLVLWKGGQTEGGARATLSHTAAVAGSWRIWDGMCRQTGIIPVHSMQEAVFTTAALMRMDLPAGPNVAVLGGAGGGSVTMTDLAEKEGLRVPRLSERTIRSLEEFVPPQGNSVQNPLDVFLFKEEHFFRLMDLLREDPRIDALVYNWRIRWMYRDMGRSGIDHNMRMIIRARERLEKPMVMVLEREGEPEMDLILQDAEGWFHESGIATFPSFELAARVLSSLARYRDFLAQRAADKIPSEKRACA